jgi:hypothetical protein
LRLYNVVDYGDGTYGLTFTVPRAGDWRAHLAARPAIIQGFRIRV